MRVNSINSNVNFQTVNQKYLQRAQKEYKQIHCLTNDLLFCMETDVMFKDIPIQDAIDTLKAIKAFAKDITPDLNKEIEYYTKLLGKQS